MEALPCYRNTRQRLFDGFGSGFTLLEMLVTLAIVGVMTTMAVGFYSGVQRSAVTAEVNQLVTHLSLARSEAIKRGHKSRMCPSVNGRDCAAAEKDHTPWHAGYLVFSDTNDDKNRDDGEPIIAVHSGALSTVAIKTTEDRSNISYQPDGLASGNTATFTFCAPNAGDTRYVILSNTGRPRVSPVPPEDSTSTPTCP